MKKVIELRGVTKQFDGETVRDSIDLDIYDNEFLTLLGPSGCGKTTTLRMIGGFETPDQGDILFLGERINDIPPHKRNINTVFQRYALFPHLNVFENVAFPLREQKLPRDEIEQKVNEMLALVKLTGFERRIFGWDVPAASAEYRAFLEAFLPALRTALEGMGYDKEHVYYHISDEPSPEHLDSYRAAKAQAEDLLEGCQVIDALSSLEFYRQGLVRQPVPANDHIQPFIDAQVPGLWVYYCCAQSSLVPNRFFAMESARNHIMGVLMYLYGIKGFLHWGYNFYNSKFSLHPVDPYRVTHADYAFPSGDPFLVYPGPDGAPLSSVRAEVQDDALLDLRALRLLEQLAGRAFVEELIYADAEMRPMTFRDYPRGAGYLLALRERVAAEIESRLA